MQAMKCVVTGMLAVATATGVTVATASMSSAEVRTTIWRCYEGTLTSNSTSLPKSQYYACPQGTVQSFYTDTGARQWKRDGLCLNQYWNNHNRTTNYQAAVDYCATH